MWKLLSAFLFLLGVKESLSSGKLRSPHFSGDSFIKHSAPSDTAEYLELELRFKPTGNFGLIFFEGNFQLEQYVAVYLRNAYVYLHFDLGNGASVLRSEFLISLGQWHKVEVWRTGKGGLLKVDKQAWIEGVAAGGFTHMQPTNHVYVGGAPEDILTTSVQSASRSGFHGCLQNVVLNGVHLEVNAAESITNVRECDSNPCVPNPCGRGNCILYHDEYLCLCPFPYSGQNCHKRQKHLTSIGLEGSGFLRFRQYEVMKHITGDLLDLSVRFRLTNVSGTQFEGRNQILLFAGNETLGGDYMEVSVTPGGRVKTSLDLGSGPVTITHDRSNVKDYKWHNVTVKRTGRKVTVIFDDHVPETTVSPEGSAQLNVYKALYIGGYLPKHGLFLNSGLYGCIEEVVLGQNFRIDHPGQASSAVNVDSC